MFDTEQLIEDCRKAVAESDTREHINEILRAAVAQPDAVIRILGEPMLAGIEKIYQTDDLTIINVVWGPGMQLHPHNHEMWANIGIYTGREDNTFYRRSPDGLEVHGVKTLETGDTIPLGESIIHAVTNPLGRMTGAIHIYGGDFFETPRSEWDPVSFEEKPYDIEHTRQVFAASNRIPD